MHFIFMIKALQLEYACIHLVRQPKFQRRHALLVIRLFATIFILSRINESLKIDLWPPNLETYCEQ